MTDRPSCLGMREYPGPAREAPSTIGKATIEGRALGIRPFVIIEDTMAKQRMHHMGMGSSPLLEQRNVVFTANGWSGDVLQHASKAGL